MASKSARLPILQNKPCRAREYSEIKATGPMAKVLTPAATLASTLLATLVTIFCTCWAGTVTKLWPTFCTMLPIELLANGLPPDGPAGDGVGVTPGVGVTVGTAGVGVTGGIGVGVITGWKL